MVHQVNEEAGTSKKAGPAFLIVGRLGKTHGVQGEIELQVFTDFPERLVKGKKLYLGEEKQEVILQGVRQKNKVLLITLSAYTSPEAARALTNSEVFVKTSEVPPLADGQYYFHELIGLDVVEDGISLGELEEILETGANDVFVVRAKDGAELLLPDIPEVVLEIDLEAGKVFVNVPEGLRDE